jgi:DNA-binding MarR family transcriptional regulator/N-acetylglutamate synthase-like GNAT family acetyltransferase
MADVFLDELGVLAAGTRLKRISDSLYRLADHHYRAANLPFQARWFVPYQYLLQCKRTTIGEMAKATGMTHVAIKKLVDQMATKHLLNSTPDPKDKRKRHLSLTDKGRDLEHYLQPLWDTIRDALTRDPEIRQALTRLEKGLSTDKNHTPPTCRIIDYHPHYRKYFYDLNKAWVEKFFQMEPEDEASLSNPEAYFLAKGGFVFFALQGNDVVGTAALKRIDDGYELCKMAVQDDAQGQGIGRQLIAHCRNRARQNDAARLFLQSNAILAPAMRLYEGSGFRYLDPKATPADYRRADVMMEMRLDAVLS